MSQEAPADAAATLHPHTGLLEATSSKLQQLLSHESGALAQAAMGRCPFLAMQTGLAQRDDDNSLKAGVRGPTLMEDQVLREKINHFDHERIPERVVHARGTGAHGFFQCFESLSEVTRASLFQDPQATTPVFVRFSTVLGSRGSADTVRDVRGFAVKFYTEEGNWDLVGNNIPVFFIQDAMKFPDLIHAGKPEQQTEMPQAQTAHDNFWDFISWTPESMHMMAWAVSDRAIPASFRMMQGFGVHTFVFVNARGERTFFKAHWKPALGVHGLAWDECVKLQGVDPDFHRRDLYSNISAGNFPQWDLGLQLVKEKDEEKFEFDILDATKIIPEELVPIRWVGRLTLDRVPADFFAEVEQVAFCTQNIVPGIDFSHDPLLQGRNFSYLDTQLSRLGSANFNQLPINRPLHDPLNNQRDGHMQMKVHTDKLNYFPNRLSAQGKSARPGNGGETQADLAAKRADAFASYAASVEGTKVRAKAPKFMERFNQACLFYNSQTRVEQAHMLKGATFELSKVDDLGVRSRMVAMWNQVDHEFATQLAANIGVAPPGAPDHVNDGRTSKYLSMIASPYSPADGCATRRVACLIADGFDAKEMATLKAALEKEGAELIPVATRRGIVYADGVKKEQDKAAPDASAPDAPASKSKADPECRTVNAGFTLENCKSVIFDGVALLSGSHVSVLSQSGAALSFVYESLKHCKTVCASRNALELLAHPTDLAGLTLAGEEGDSVCVDDGVISSRGGVTSAFCAAVIESLKHHRAWERKGVDQIPA